MSLIKEIDYPVDYNELFYLLEDIINNHDIVRRMNGLAIQHRKDVPIPWNIVDGLERLKLYNGISEKDFCQIHEKFCNTQFENLSLIHI